MSTTGQTFCNLWQIYVNIYKKNIYLFLLVQREESKYFKMNRFTKRFISFKAYLVCSYVRFNYFAFFRKPRMFFSCAVLSLYRGRCFDGLVISFKLVIGSLQGRLFLFPIFFSLCFLFSLVGTLIYLFIYSFISVISF